MVIDRNGAPQQAGTPVAALTVDAGG